MNFQTKEALTVILGYAIIAVINLMVCINNGWI